MVEVDGRPLGPAPLAGIALSRGEHRVIAHYADGSVALKTIYLAVRRRLDLVPLDALGRSRDDQALRSSTISTIRRSVSAIISTIRR